MRSELFAVSPIDGSAIVLGVTPTASSQMYFHVAPLSCDGRMPYDVLKTMRSGLLGEKTI